MKPNLAVLTERQREVYELRATGLSLRKIARQLGITMQTVCHHLDRAERKLVK